MKRKDIKGRVLKDGESQRSDGRYCYRYTGLDGKRKYVYDLDLNKLREKEKKIQLDIADGIYSANMTVNELFDRYMKVRKPVRDTTRKAQTQLYGKHIRTAWLGRKQVAKLKKSDVMLFYTEMSKNYAQSTVRTVHCILYSMFELAIDDDLIRKNPAKGCIKAYSGQTKREALTPQETERFLRYYEDCGSGRSYMGVIKMMLWTGVRVGEATALTWQDIDFRAKTISINKQLVMCDGVHVSPPKSESGYRTIPMSDELLIMLKQLQKASKNEILVFSTANGKPLLKSNIDSFLRKLVCRYNSENEEKLPNISCHTFRHTFCTRLAEAGIQPKALQYLMGHSSYVVTSNIYITANPQHVQEEYYRVSKRA